MQILLILVVLMIVMCMFNKTRETFETTFKGYGKFENAFCKLTNRNPARMWAQDIKKCIDTCDRKDKCEGFNAQKIGENYICTYSTDNRKHCGNYKNRKDVDGIHYFFKTPEMEAGPASPISQGIGGMEAASSDCAKLAQDKVLQFRKNAIEAIMKIS